MPLPNPIPDVTAIVVSNNYFLLPARNTRLPPRVAFAENLPPCSLLDRVAGKKRIASAD